MPSPAELVAACVAGWLADEDSDVVAAEMVEGRWAVRMRQTVREATTVWWDVGERSIRAEAYVLPAPESGGVDVYRLCLLRNAVLWRVHYALDDEGAVVIRGRISVAEANAERLDLMLAEIYEQVELTFSLLVGLARREKSL